jgi:hypothetical protein
MACHISPPGPMIKQSEWEAKSRGVESTQPSAGKVLVVKQFPNAIPVGTVIRGFRAPNKNSNGWGLRFGPGQCHRGLR